MMDYYALLQLDQTAARERFMSLTWLREQGLEPKPEHYDLIYTGEVNQEWKNPQEELFVLFNTKIPVDFTGHAMSVSDIVALLTGGKATRYYYCDSVGFKRLTGFKHPAVEQHYPNSILLEMLDTGYTPYLNGKRVTKASLTSRKRGEKGDR